MQIIDGTIASPKGFYATGLHAGLKKEKKDLGVIYSEVPANAAAVYTTNQVKAAPIFVTKEAMKDTTIQAVVVNSGTRIGKCKRDAGDNRDTFEYPARKRGCCFNRCDW